MHSLLIVGLVLLVRVIKVMELPVKHYSNAYQRKTCKKMAHKNASQATEGRG